MSGPFVDSPAPFVVSRLGKDDAPTELDAAIRPIADNSEDPDWPHEEGVAINFVDGKRHYEILLRARDLRALLDQFPSEIVAADAELVKQVLVMRPTCICEGFCNPDCDTCNPKVH